MRAYFPCLAVVAGLFLWGAEPFTRAESPMPPTDGTLELHTSSPRDSPVAPDSVVVLGLRNKWGQDGDSFPARCIVITPSGARFETGGFLTSESYLEFSYPKQFPGASSSASGSYQVLFSVKGQVVRDSFSVTGELPKSSRELPRNEGGDVKNNEGGEVKVENYSNEPVFVAIAYKKPKNNLDAEGWIRINKNDSHTFGFVNSNDMYIRIEKNGKELKFTELNTYSDWPVILGDRQKFRISRAPDCCRAS